jgi:hypothetical protein
MTPFEKWKIRRELKLICRGKQSPEEIESALKESAPLRGRLLADESAELLGRAMALGIIPVDLMPFRFGSPMWLEEGGYQYLSQEAKQAVEKALSTSKVERFKTVMLWVAPIAGLIGAITGIAAMLKK